MGLGASQARLLMLTARKSDLELRLQQINQMRMMIANMMGQLTPINANLEPHVANTMVQNQQRQMAAIQAVDKNYEMQARTIDTQHQAVQTEIEAVSKVISKNIESSFKLMG